MKYMTILYNMVKSQIYPDKINYNESKQVDDEDIGYASTIYDIELWADAPIRRDNIIPKINVKK